MPQPLLLASGSPRRRELLSQWNIPYEVVIASITELDASSAPLLTPTQLAVTNARRKAEAVARANPARVVLGADTIVVLANRIFGKPGSLTEAREFLHILSGRSHQVITGCALIPPNGQTEFFHDESNVTFLQLTDELITRYIDAVEVLDKAGAYALQQHGDWIVAQVEGSRSNIIGLPMEKLSERLRSHGYFPNVPVG